MEFNREMFYQYIDTNKANFYVIFTTVAPDKHARAILIPRDVMRRIADDAPELLDGSTDGVPRIKLLSLPALTRGLNRCGYSVARAPHCDFNCEYKEFEKGVNGTRSAALEKACKAMFLDNPAVVSVHWLGGLRNSERGLISDLRVNYINGTYDYIEVKCRLGRFNVNSGRGYSMGDND